MHEFSVADAFRPNPTSVLGLPLEPYSIGHELILLRRRNAFLTLSEAEFSLLDFWQQLHAIREAVWLCSDSYGARERFERPSWFMLGMRWNERKRRMWVCCQKELLPEDYALAVADFRNYLVEAHPRIPSPGKFAIEVLYPDDAESRGRSYGQPMVLSLYHFVIGLPAKERPKCAWDFPYAKAMWLYFSKLESGGAFRIENFEERDEQSVMDEVESERRTKKSEAISHKPEPVKESGLATEVPDELKGGGK